MTNLIIEKTVWDDLSTLKDDYLDNLTNKPDGFWDDMVFSSTTYRILLDEKLVGFFTLDTKWEGYVSLTSFYLQRGSYRFSKEIFTKIVEGYNVTRAFVTSSDELFVSLAFEKMHELKGSFDMQSYYFCDRDKASVRPPEFGRELFQKVEKEEYDLMNNLTQQEWEGDLNDDTIEFYKLSNLEGVLGYGLITRHRLNNYVDVGNYTLCPHRRRGVGRSMIINLAEVANERGLKVTVGCWYYNQESVRTLLSSGFTTPSRMFCVNLKNGEDKI